MARITDSNAIDNANATTIDDVIELLAEHRLGGMAKATETLTNEVMRFDRC